MATGNDNNSLGIVEVVARGGRGREKESRVETWKRKEKWRREKERKREHFLYEEARLFTSAGTKWKMLDSTRSEQY